MATSILSRKLDLFYLVFFCMGLLSMFLIDLQALYPPSLVPEFMANVKKFYLDTYKDQFFVQTPPFFEFFMWTEVFIQGPVMFWSLGGLLRDSPKVPLVLLPFGVLIFVTTGACMYEFSFWDVPLEQKISLSTLYGPYLAISAFITVDMYLRLNKIINRSTVTSNVGGKKLQ